MFTQPTALSIKATAEPIPDTEHRLMKGMIKSHTYVANELARSRRHAREDTDQIKTQANTHHEELLAEIKEVRQDVQLLRAVLRCFDEQSDD